MKLKRFGTEDSPQPSAWQLCNSWDCIPARLPQQWACRPGVHCLLAGLPVEMREARRFPAPTQISRAAGHLAILLGLPGLLRVARLLPQLSHSGPQHHLLVPWCSSKSQGLDVLAEVLLPALALGAQLPPCPCRSLWPQWLGTPLSATPPSHPSRLAAGDIRAQHGKTPGHLVSLSRRLPRTGAMHTGGQAWPSLPPCGEVSAPP